MAAALNLSWQTLPVSRTESNSAMLVRHAFGSEGYTIQITDLSSVWSESLTSQEVIKRAEVSESSIDPSGDGQQLSILFQKIAAAVDGEDGTALNLSFVDDHKQLLLKTTSPLPHPFRPLTWRLCLERVAEEAVKCQFVIPLLGWSYFQNFRVNELARLLTEKDAVITKILDKVESLGIDLESIFPSAGSSKPGRRGKRRELIAHHVKGLAPFEKDAWMEGLHPGTQVSLGFDTLIQEAFTGSKTSNVKEFIASIPGGTSTASIPDKETEDCLRQNSHCQQGEFQRQDTPPQKHEGNERLQSRRAQERNEQAFIAVDDDSTDEEYANQSFTPTNFRHGKKRSKGDSDTPSPMSTSGRHTGIITQVRKRGKIGGINRHHDEADSVLKSTAPAHDGDETAATTISDFPVSRKGLGQSRESTVEPSSVRPQESGRDSHGPSTGSSNTIDPMMTAENSMHAESPRKFGRIGGRSANQVRVSKSRAAETLPPARSENSDHAGCQSTVAHTPTRRKLGRIGGQSVEKESDASPDAVSQHGHVSSSSRETLLPAAYDSSQPVSRGQEERCHKRDEDQGSILETPASASATERSPTPPESSQQRANRKRTELQKELEEKAKTHGKKRRRF